MSFVLICAALLFFFLFLDNMLKQHFDIVDNYVLFSAFCFTSLAAWVFWPQ
jgi:hypothetical protein